jgi:hypothetical protein
VGNDAGRSPHSNETIEARRPSHDEYFEITDWSHVASFFIWTLAVCAIAKAIFGSLLAAELHYRLSLRDTPRRQRMNRLNWEINNRAKWDEDAARRSPHAAKQPLSDEELSVITQTQPVSIS